jgi:peptidoglycan/LPS O-acetylase OafA/YrhL
VEPAAATAAPAEAPLRPGMSWPAFDGLRAVAAVAVLGFHTGVLRGGYLGVDVFFVISGFLITSLLIGEHDRNGRISFQGFWARRALRLLPALGCVLVAANVLAVLLDAAGGLPGREVARGTFVSVPWVLCFAANWGQAFGLAPAGDTLGPTWSLAVEEQFYLVWPLVLAWLLRRGVSRARAAGVLAGLAAADMAYRAVMAHIWGWNTVFYGTDTRCDGLLAGCAVAFWLASGVMRAPEPILRAGAWLGAGALAAVFALGSYAGMVTQVPAAVIATALIVTATAAHSLPARLERMLRSGPVAWTGRRSYGLYIWQYVIIAPITALWARYGGTLSPVGLRLCLGLSLIAVTCACFAIAALSWRLVESPALSLARRYRA